MWGRAVQESAPGPARSGAAARLVAPLTFLLGAGLLVAVTWPVPGVVELGVDLPERFAPAWWVTLALLAAQAVGIGWWVDERRPALLLAAAAAPLAALAGAGAATGATAVAVVVAAFRLAARRSGRRPLVAGLVAGVLVASGEMLSRSAADTTATQVLEAMVQAVGTVALPALVGSLTGIRREAADARTAHAEALVREHDALVQAAIAQERTAMARELHDVAAHHLTGIAVMTGALDRKIETDPEGARAAVAEVRVQSTSLLRDLRRLIGALRTPDTEGSANPAAGIGEVADLVESFRADGLEVAYSVLPGGVTTPIVDVGPLAGLCVHRTVQEALANAARHAPGGSCTVTLDVGEVGRIEVTVLNGPGRRSTTSTGSGLGLVGMRERAELTGSHLEVGPTADGGWQVRLRVPRASAPSGEEPR